MGSPCVRYGYLAAWEQYRSERRERIRHRNNNIIAVRNIGKRNMGMKRKP